MLALHSAPATAGGGISRFSTNSLDCASTGCMAASDGMDTAVTIMSNRSLWIRRAACLRAISGEPLSSTATTRTS